MKNYIFFDGTNEIGPFTEEEIRLLPITRTTPVRLAESDRWTTPDKIAELRPFVVPQRTIRTAADVIPVMRERVTNLHYRRPNALYGSLLVVGLLTCIGIYSSKKMFGPGRKGVAVNSTKTEAITTAECENKLARQKEMELNPLAQVAKRATVDSVKSAPNNWRELITVQKSNYGYGVLGGISNLQIVAINRTAYAVEELQAKLIYIKANGKVWKTKIITIRNIPPRSKKAVDVEDVIRSKKVTLQLRVVRSKGMNLSYESS